MKVLIDQIELKVAHPTLAGALDAARNASGSSGRVIIEALLDGQPLTDEQMLEPSDEPIDAKVLELTTTDPKALVRTTLLDVSDALAQTRDAQGLCASSLQRGEMGPALAQLREIVETWSHVRRVMAEGPALLGLGLGELEAMRPEGTAPITQRIHTLTHALDELRTQVSAQDWSSLADLLEGELDQLAGEWEEVMRTLAQRLVAP
jgi:hypothetical protein